jgi:DNA-binding MarR family transcriptional regulator
MKKTNPTRQSVSKLTSHTGFWLRFVSNHVSHTFARRLLDSGVTVAEWVVLREMYERDEMSPSELAAGIGVTRGAASKLIERLAAKKLVMRQGRSDDRRYQDIELTSSGRRLVPALAAIADENDKDFFTPLSAKEHEVLVSTLKKLVQAHGLHKLPTE